MKKDAQILTEYVIVAEYDDGVEVSLDVLAPDEENAMKAFVQHMGPGYQIISIDEERYEEEDEGQEEDEPQTTSIDNRTEELTSQASDFTQCTDNEMEEL